MWPRRDARSVNNPPAPRRRRVRPCPLVPGGPVVLPKSLLAGVRVTRRGNRLDPFFFIIFSDLIFSCQNPPQGLSKEHLRDSRITPNLIFCRKRRIQNLISIDFSVDLCFSRFLGRFATRFPWKNNEKKQEFWHSCAGFFEVANPYDSIYFTIWTPLSVFLLLLCFSIKILQISTQKRRPKKRQKMMPLGAQNPHEMLWNSMIFMPKTAHCTKRAIFWKVASLPNFCMATFATFWRICCPRWGPKNSYGRHFCGPFCSSKLFF